MENEKDFRERLGNDINTVRKMLYLEEFKSFIAALGFAANACCIVMLPLSWVTLVNVWALWYCGKQFKPTIKRQIMFGAHLKFLKTIKNEKIWTQGDKN